MSGRMEGRARVRTARLSVGDRILIQQLDHGTWHPGRLKRHAVPGTVVSVTRTNGRMGSRSAARFRLAIRLDSGVSVSMDAGADEVQFLADGVGPTTEEQQ